MRTLVVGAGRMGHGIALCYALGGHGVDLVDTDEGGFARARAAIGAAAALLADNELRTSTEVEQAIERIHFGTDLAAAAAQAGLVEEAIPEDLPAKQRLLEEIESTAPDEAMLATNTSSLRIGAIGARMTHPERLIGIHWVAPPYLVPTVEIVRTPTTPVELVDRAKQMLIGLGKVPVVVPDVAGFAVNRLQYALFAAATDLVEQGILEPAEVDQVIRDALAPRQLAFGLLELFDLVVSGRTVLAVSDYLVRETGDDRYRATPRVRAMVEAGRLGASSGGGWFDYDASPEDIARRRDATFALVYRAMARIERQKPSIGTRRE